MISLDIRYYLDIIILLDYIVVYKITKIVHALIGREECLHESM